MVVSSFGRLQTFREPTRTYSVEGRVSAFDAMSAATYASIYRTQPNVRTVIDFLARNIAQLSIHVYRRESDTDRTRLADHELVRWLDQPNPGTTRYRLFESLMQDLGIYFNAYWLKVRKSDKSIGLARIPPESITVNGWLVPRSFTWTLPDGRELELLPREVVYFNGYDPCDPLMGLSPLETLRQTLAEETAATGYRKAYWQNSARLEGIIERPKDAPKWTPDQKQSWREQWQTRFAGPHNAGQTAILEDGMTFKAASYSAKDSEFIAARKLTREEVAAAYHVPLPMVGILEHATFSNIKEQHKHLYQDTLGPWCQMIVEEIHRQLLIECIDQDRIYEEFNIAEKLKGSFEEQAASLFYLVGRPIMTANEGRARLNLPSIKNDPSADELALPLNTATGPSLETGATTTTPTKQQTEQAQRLLTEGEADAAA